MRFGASILTVAMGFTAPAQALSNRTFVSGQGSDTNLCSLSAPCRSFASAIAQTNSGGEIVILDTAGYGTIVIDKPVSIVNPLGVYAGITIPAGGTGVTVLAAPVSVRGLSIDGGGVGSNGIVYTGSGLLEVLDCRIRGVTSRGISIGVGSGSNVIVADTTVSNATDAAVFVRSASSGAIKVSMTRVNLNNSGIGFSMRSSNAAYGYATIVDSFLSENGTGLSIVPDNGTSPNTTRAVTSNTAIMNNASSIFIGNGVSLIMERTTVAAALFNSSTNNGTIVSFGDNAILDTFTGNAFQARSLK